MNTDRTKHTPWPLIMRELVGLRLRMFDEMLCNGSAPLPEAPAEMAAAQWLHRHQFVWLDEADQALRPRTIAKAREHWECHGPADDVAALEVPTETTPEPEPMAVTTEARPIVHAGQMEVFALEGYSL